MAERDAETFVQWQRRVLHRYLAAHPTLLTAGPASLVSTIASFPFDSIKSRLQVKHYPSVFSCARAVLREEGVRGFFRGVTIPLVTITFVRTSSFSIYSGTKAWLERHVAPNPDRRLGRTAAYGALGGITSGMLISCGSAPFELVKVQRQLEFLINMQRREEAQRHGRPDLAAKVRSQTGFQAAREIMRVHGGVRGFYLGFPLHMARDMLGSSFYFGLYDTIRVIADRYESRLGLPSAVVSFLLGSTAGITSWLVVYPVDLIKTKVQRDALAGELSRSAVHVFRSLLSAAPDQSAVRGVPLRRFLRLYRGLGISAVRSFISHGITWMMIETLSRHRQEMLAQLNPRLVDFSEYQ